MGVHKTTISRYRRDALEDKYLIPQKPHHYDPKHDVRDSAEFRFDVSRFVRLADKAAPGLRSEVA
jgi:hypothetical protein